jgi:cation transport regulator ChaC
MAFKSIGQKYGFVSAGDVYRQRIAEERQKAEFERQKAAEERQKAETAEAELAQASADTEVVLREMGMSDERIAEMQAKLEAMRQSRLAQNKTM